MFSFCTKLTKSLHRYMFWKALRCSSIIFVSVFFSCIRSIKHYFLMDKGDFFVHFMDLTEEELKKPVDDIVPPRLEALLELALRMSTANTDPFKDDLKVGRTTDEAHRRLSLLPSPHVPTVTSFSLLCLSSSLLRST